jgi:hypothetical protein
MPSVRVLLLVMLLFMLVVILRLPAAWVAHALPAPLVCGSPAGTAWNGRCDTLRIGTLSLANLSWELLPDELLHGKLGMRARLDDVALQASGKALVSLRRHVQAYDLVAHLPLPSALAPGMPLGWSGMLELDLPRLETQGATLQSLRGAVRLSPLQQTQPPVDYGGFEWQLADGALHDGHLSGAVHDLGGPTRLQGTLSVGLKGDYDLNARIAAGPGADEALQQSLQQLGAADAQGFRPLLAAGTF